MNYSFPLRIGHHDAAETVAMQFLDANNVPVPGLTAVITGALVGSETGPANGLIEPGKNYSELRIALHAPNGGDLSMLSTIEKLKWTIPLSAAANSVDLNSADYVEGRVWLELNSGLEIDIKELLNSLNSGDDDGGDDGGDGGQQQ